MSWILPSVITLVVGYAVIYFIQSQRTQRIHQDIIALEGCKPPKCLPNKLFPPFGLDKLGKVTEAERTRTYPLLMLHDHEKHGDTYTQWGGSMYTVITRDPRNLRVILSRQFKSEWWKEHFEVGSGRHGCIKPLLGDGIFTQDGPQWELSRKLLAPLIQRPTLPDVDLIERHWQRLLSRIESQGSLVDLKAPLFDLSLDLTTEFLLGGKSATLAHDTEGHDWTDDFAKEFNTAFKWISKRERLKVFYWMVDSREFRNSCAAARKIIDQVVERSIQNLREDHEDEESYIALEPLLREQKNVRLVRDQFLNLLLAGRDTSGSLLCWVFYSLAREPELASALRAEVTGLSGTDRDRKPTKRELGKMPLLDQFITETLRVFPPVPINGRFSTSPTFLPHGGGPDGESPMLVPKGTLIAFSTFATHHNQKLYGDDPGRFRVDRWKDDMIKERRMIDWSYHPFIGGPRKCLGERFAIIQAKYLTCRMLQHFDSLVASDESGALIEPKADGRWVEDVKYHVGLTMSPDDGVWIRLT